MWTDTNHELALHYGAIDDPAQEYTNRRTKILDESGVLVLEYVDKVVAGAHPKEVLEDVKKIRSR